MNIHISASREIKYKDKNDIEKTDVQEISFDCWQTPTKASYKIIDELTVKDRLESYKKYILDLNCTYESEEWASYDDMCKASLHGDSNIKPIGIKVINTSQEHVNELTEWINDVEEKGYRVEIDVW